MKLLLALDVLLWVLCTVRCDTLRVAWLAPEAEANYLKAASSMGGIALGIDQVEADTGLLTGTDFLVKWKDSGCISKTSLSAMYDILIKEQFDPHVVIGPPCSAAMQYVGQLAGYRDIPIFGWLSTSAIFDRKTVFSSLIRVLPPVNAIARSLMEILLEFDWRLIELIASSEDQYQQLGEGVREQADIAKITVTRYVDNADGENPDLSKITGVYSRLKKEARIVVLCLPLSALRSWMIAAYDNKMTSGDYAFIFINGDLPTQDFVDEITSQSFWEKGDADDHKAKQAYQSLLLFSMQSENVNNTNSFKEDADQAANQSKWTTMLGMQPEPSDRYSGYLHDAVRLYAALVDEEKTNGTGMFRNGSVLFDRAKNREFSGPEWATGDVYLDENADRMPVFYLYNMGWNSTFQLVQQTVPRINQGQLEIKLQHVEDIIWGNGKTGNSSRPKAIPDCGFNNEFCKDITLYIAIPVPIIILLLAAIIGFFVYRKVQFEKSLNDMAWKLSHSDLQKIDKDKVQGSMFLRLSRGSNIHHSQMLGMGDSGALQRSKTEVTKAEMLSIASGEPGQVFINTARYKGTTVAVKPVLKEKVKVDRNLLVDMRNMMTVKHSNLATFIGATIDPPISEVWEYYTKGSLQDVIENENITLDDMFKYSIGNDILKGLGYIHNSPLKVHGRLKSSNVVVDGRWVCKLMDYGLETLRQGQLEEPELTEHKRYSSLYWAAPELMAMDESGQAKLVGKSTAGDIYAAAIILKEAFARNAPYTEHDDFSPMEIIERVKRPVPPGEKPFRPSLHEVRCQGCDQLKEAIQRGWAQNEGDRPSAQHFQKELQRINPFKSTSVMDNMVKMLEKYSSGLEELVQERTVQVEEEKKKSEILLFRMLPKSVAEDLKLGKPIEAEHFEAVTIYFSDIVKFTNLSAASTPMQVVALLNKLYTIWDAIIAEHDVYKVETIGDAYMVVSGVPIRNKDNHAAEIANTAMDLLSGILNFEVPHMPDYKLRIRIGLHTGPVVAGVVGHAMPRYCLFGSTVNTAASFEAGGAPMRIHISETTVKLLSKFTGYQIADRGSSLDCKGGVKFHSYWLMGRDGYTKPWPDFDELAAEDSPKPIKLPTTNGRKFRSSVSRPSQESGIFDVEPSDVQMSRKSSCNDDAKRLEGIVEGEPLDVKPDSARSQPAVEPLPSIQELDDMVFTPAEVRPPPNAALGLKREKTLAIQDLEDMEEDPVTPSGLTELEVDPISDQEESDQSSQSSATPAASNYDETKGNMDEMNGNVEPADTDIHDTCKSNMGVRKMDTHENDKGTHDMDTHKSDMDTLNGNAANDERHQVPTPQASPAEESAEPKRPTLKQRYFRPTPKIAIDDIQPTQVGDDLL